jgi:hypothetical protein
MRTAENCRESNSKPARDAKCGEGVGSVPGPFEKMVHDLRALCRAQFDAIRRALDRSEPALNRRRALDSSRGCRSRISCVIVRRDCTPHPKRNNRRSLMHFDAGCSAYPFDPGCRPLRLGRFSCRYGAVGCIEKFRFSSSKGPNPNLVLRFPYPLFPLVI